MFWFIVAVISAAIFAYYLEKQGRDTWLNVPVSVALAFLLRDNAVVLWVMNYWALDYNGVERFIALMIGFLLIMALIQMCSSTVRHRRIP